jgi:DNA-binding NtrC family response regulator
MADLLLVDDDVRIVETTAWLLERAGHQVRTARSYREVRVLLSERVPDLMLADLNLGLESGAEELPRLWSEGLLPRTLVISGYVDRELATRMASIPGVVGTLRKPVEWSTLEAEIAASLPVPARRSSPGSP